jgi:3-hydroxyisobutyrate dehydrogenase-like beta-hydroxyacid dehydrogenase
MAQNLKKNGFDVTGYDPSEASKQRAGEAGLKVASTVAEAAAG